MSPLLTPQQAGQEALCCAALGLALGAVRALAPLRRSAAFLPDFALVGLLLALLQGYAAGPSWGGQLRWYMLAGAAAGVLAAQALLARPCAALRAVLAWPLRWAARRAAARRAARRAARAARAERAKERRNVKRLLKKQKKNLQNQPRMLYNSNVAVCGPRAEGPGATPRSS